MRDDEANAMKPGKLGYRRNEEQKESCVMTPSCNEG